MSAIELAGLVVSAALMIYLFYAMLYPEKL